MGIETINCHSGFLVNYTYYIILVVILKGMDDVLKLVLENALKLA